MRDATERALMDIRDDGTLPLPVWRLGKYGVLDIFSREYDGFILREQNPDLSGRSFCCF